jgi:predicted transcriptional regulator of viral defense system
MIVSKEIENIVSQSKRGKLFFVSDFLQYGNYDTVRKTLQRLVTKGILIRISKGIYYYPKIDKILGILYPTAEEIAKSIAKRDKAKIIPTGAYAQHLLGLSTQIPMNVVYLTDGSARKIEIGNQTIVFKKTSPKNLYFESKLSSLIIQSLKSLKESNVNETVKQKITDIIKQSGEKEKIKKDIKNAPIWIQKIMLEILSKISNELA